MTANPVSGGVALDFTVPIGPTGPQGAAGIQGVKGDLGPTGPTGPAPVLSVAESTQTTYKLRFQSGGQEVISPNLKSNIEYFNADLSKSGSIMSVPIGKLILTVQNTSSSSVRIAIRAADASAPVLADIRRASIYNGAAVEAQTNDNTTITGTLVLDDLVYSQSQEMHFIRIRQRDPVSGLWSMCQVDTFPSYGGARTSVCLNWFYTGASFQAP